MSFEKVIESAIQEAIAEGMFDNLPGAGKPLPFNDQELMAGENWLGYKVLLNGGMVPGWLDLGHQIESDLQKLRQLESQHQSLIDLAVSTGDWERNRIALGHALKRYEDHARSVRRKQDNYNLSAPGMRTERPAIWVEHHLERLRKALRDAGYPFAD
ncbi:MAG: DUF1992 domain-containing protein [Anaerolineaceae bacterium]